MATVINPDNNLYIVNGDLEINGSVTAGDVDLDNVRINSTNDVDLDNIPATFNDANAALNIQGGAWVGGNLYTAGTFVANGDIVTLGNSGGSLTLNGNISSDVLPSEPYTYNIGSPTNQWYTVNTSALMLEADPEEITSAALTAVSSIYHIGASTPAAVSLADGSEGQLLHIVCTSANNVQISPSNAMGYTTISFTSVGDSVIMLFTGGKWAVTSHFRSSVL